MITVLKALYLLLVAACLFLQACAPDQESENRGLRKPDMAKASFYNVQLGLGYLNQGDRPRAKRKLLTALKQQPNSPDANSAMAYYFEQTKELTQAKQYYLKALSLSANDGAHLNNYGAFLCRRGDYKNAEVYFLKAVKDMEYTHTAGAYENAGLCALSAANEDKAMFYFKKALNHDPSRKISFYELLKLENKTGHNADAMELVQKHTDLVLNDRLLLSLAQLTARKAGRDDIAVEYEQKMKKYEKVE